MNSSLGSEIVTGFIGEVEGYLPDMSRCLQTLQQDRAHRPSLAELHRITHTIKGAAAMVGLDDLSGIGEVLEKVMEKVLGTALTLDDETITLLGDATRRIDSYCMMQRSGKPDDGRLFQKTVAEIEKKLCKSSKNGVGSGELEDSPEGYNPEAILFEEGGEEGNLPEATPDALDNDLGSAEDNTQVSGDAEPESFLDEITLSVAPAEADVEDELLFQDIEEEEEDDLFGSAVTEPSDLPGAEEIDPELLQCFSEETDEHLENIDDCLNSLGVRITDSVALTPSTQETLHSLRRSVHTLKGAAAVIGIEQVAAWGHDFEDFLDWLHDEARKLDPSAVAALREGADLLASLAEEPTRPAEKEKQRITVKFAEITEAFSSGSAVAENDKSEETASSLLFDEAENPLYPSQESQDSEEAEEADSFFDEIASSVSSVSPAEENAADRLFLQDVEEEEEKEDDLFGSALTEPSDLPGAEEIDPELLQCFSEETDEHLKNIDHCLNSLGVRITDSVELTPSTQETLHSLRRSVHTLKGAAAVIGIEQVAAWGHDFEDFLDWLHDEARKLDPSVVAALRDGADLLASLAEEPTHPAEKEKQRITVKFAEITEAFSSGFAADENDKGEENTSSLVLDEENSVADFFTEADCEESEEADAGNLFDEISSPDPPAEEAMEGELLFQDVAEEEDNLFGSVVAGPTESPEDQAFFPEEEGVPEELQAAEETGREGGEEADNFFDEVPVDTPDGAEAAFESLPDISGSDEQAVGEDIDEELLRCFHEEAEEHLDNIDRQLNHLGMTISGATKLSDIKRSSLHSIRRSVHTLKGASAVIGIEQIAAWGHDFEDFLDWLHDEARSIHPEAVEAMQEGADILVRLVRDPNCSVRADQQGVLGKFTRITTGDIGKLSIDDRDGIDNTDDINEGPAEDADVSLPFDHVSGEKTKTAPARQSRIRKTATLRVDVNRIDQMVGLSGDMVINLSSFEDSMDATSVTMKELDMILQRLKNINSSLEAGYELASIPHLGSQDDLRASGITEDFDPLEMDRYSELNILIRSLSEAVSDLDSIMAQNALDNVAWQKTVERQGMVLKELQNRMIGVRMTPLSTLSSRMHRTVREAERTTGHPSRLTIDGESIMMDSRVWDVMADPLMHILRNAVAHGGSLPQKAGWESLSVTIQATRKGGLCTLRVSDDGKGLDYEAIRVKGMKLYPNDRINLMSHSELAELIFRHGFSSTGSITNIAGRGVGMDVVRDAIDQLNGSIELISEQGRGTEFIMRLPVAVAQLPAILARFGTRIYAVPMHDVASVARVAPEEKTGREYTFEGETVPLLHPAEVPGFETGTGYIEEHLAEDDQALLIVHAGRKRAAVLCEQLIGQRDIVFKNLGTHLHNVPCISGVTIMGNGDLIPILQVEEFLRKWTSVIKRPDESFTAGPVKERGPLRILVVDDSISVRKVVSNFITQQGWIPVAARNGIEAIEKIREEKPDFILLDVEMPRMNGFEVLQTMQAQPELRDIPVAMLTSRSADKYQEKARELGARGFMTKPFKADEVIRFIRKETADE